jgi:hypothetical protein
LITVKNKDTGKTTEELINNQVMDTVLNQLIESLTGVDPDMEIKYLAVGTSSAALGDNQTQLTTEIFRTPPTTIPTRTATGQVETEFTILDSEAVATIEEIGIFGGSTASMTTDSGTLLSRILWHKVKTSSEEITITRIDKVVRN